jgi:anti-sigma regulatory factor (Ser/Thr protein kinase)
MTRRSELRFELLPDPRRVRDLRRDVRSKLGPLGFEPEFITHVLLVLDEIVSNAIEHGSGYRAGDAPLVVTLRRSRRDLVLDFEDPAVPEDLVRQLRDAFACRDATCPPPESERGRGIYLVLGALRDVDVTQAPRGGLHLHGRFPGRSA